MSLYGIHLGYQHHEAGGSAAAFWCDYTHSIFPGDTEDSGLPASFPGYIQYAAYHTVR